MGVTEGEARFCYPFPRPAVTVDLVVLRQAGDPDGAVEDVLLIRRGRRPSKGQWALPGGFIEPGESLGEAAARELYEETGLMVSELRQVGTFGEPGRDPRGWIISVAFRAAAPRDVTVRASDDAAEARWWPVSDLPDLAFDHAEIIELALRCN